jgi:RNA polymerase sigma factor FliA
MAETVVLDEQSQWQKWTKHRDAQAGDVLMKKYMPLVSYHVQRISIGLPKNISKDDLMSLGMYGLYDALIKFDPSRDLKFDTYASFRVKGAIIDGLRKEDWLPRNSRERTKKVESTIVKLEQKYLRKVTAQEVASELELPIKDDKNLLPDEKILKEELFTQLKEKIECLLENEQLVISLFYKEELTLTEIGQVMGLSTSRISQIHSKAILKLRKLLENIVSG